MLDGSREPWNEARGTGSRVIAEFAPGSTGMRWEEERGGWCRLLVLKHYCGAVLTLCPEIEPGVGPDSGLPAALQRASVCLTGAAHELRCWWMQERGRCPRVHFVQTQPSASLNKTSISSGFIESLKWAKVSRVFGCLVSVRWRSEGHFLPGSAAVELRAQRSSGLGSSNGSLVSAALAAAQLASIVGPLTHCGSYTTSPKCYIVKGQMLLSATAPPVSPHYMCAVLNLKVCLCGPLQPNAQWAECSLGGSWVHVVACK